MDQRGKTPDRKKRIPAEARYFSLLQKVQTGSGANPTSYSMGTGVNLQR
jgi:hypothetical protein